jgi:carbamoyl-phosphate synthase large subunit
MAVKNVLIFPGGTEIGLEIQQALKECKDIRLFSAGSPVMNHAPFVFSNHAEVANIYTEGWIDELNELIAQHHIDYIFPAYDDIIVSLAENQASINAQVISSPLETCTLTRSKKQTYSRFANVLPVPTVYENAEAVTTWPIFLKPDKGQGSQETYKVADKETLTFHLQKNPELLLLEYLPGKEYTVDCLTDQNGVLRFCSGRERIRTRAGISMSTTITHNALWREYGEIINREIPLQGAWFFQVKENSQGTLTLLEIAPRVSGSMAAHRVLGVNFPLLSVYIQAGIQIDLLLNEYSVHLDRALKNRYETNLHYTHAYVDFDDTLICNGKVNTALIALLYQLKNVGKDLTLITKSALPIQEQLARYAIAPNLFSTITHLDTAAHKIDHIDPNGAIFIDDSFQERKVVSDTYHIPTFDGSMIEVLFNDRV